MKNFKYSITSSKRNFRWSYFSELQRELEDLGGQKALVISTPQQVGLAREVAGFLVNYV